jgi:hypothetical protein
MKKQTKDTIIFLAVVLVLLWVASNLSQQTTVTSTEVDG